MKKKTSLMLDERVLVALRVEAALRRTSISEMLEMAVQAGLDRVQSKEGIAAIRAHTKAHEEDAK